MRLIGIAIYFLFKNINLRFLLPEKYYRHIEFFRTYSVYLQGATIGKQSYIRNGVFIAYPKNLSMGDRVKLGPDSRIYNYAIFSIGADTEIGAGLYVQTNEHIYIDKDSALAKQGSSSAPISIGNGVYIGANVTILKGVSVADRCIIAAGAVVVKDTEKGFIYGGVPAKKIAEIHNA